MAINSANAGCRFDVDCCLRFNLRTGHTSDGPNVHGEFRIRSSVVEATGLAPARDRYSSAFLAAQARRP